MGSRFHLSQLIKWSVIKTFSLLIILSCTAVAGEEKSSSGFSIGDYTESYLSGARDHCKRVRESAECQNLYDEMRREHVKTENKIPQCTDTEEIVSFMSKHFGVVHYAQCGFVLGEQIKDFWNDTNFTQIAKDSWSSLQANAKENRECDASIEKKRKLFELYNASVPQLMKKSVPPDSALKGKNCWMLAQQIREHDRYTKRRLDDSVWLPSMNNASAPLSGAQKDYVDWAHPTQDSTYTSGLMDMVMKKAKELGVKWECYSPAAKQAIACEIESEIALGILTGGAASMAKNTIRLGKFMDATAEARAVASARTGSTGLRALTAAEKQEMLQASSVMSDFERKAAAEKLMKRDFGVDVTPAQKQAVIDAHNAETLAEKQDILKSAGYSAPQRDEIMRTGLSGNNTIASANQTSQKALELLKNNYKGNPAYDLAGKEVIPQSEAQAAINAYEKRIYGNVSGNQKKFIFDRFNEEVSLLERLKNQAPALSGVEKEKNELQIKILTNNCGMWIKLFESAGWDDGNFSRPMIQKQNLFCK